MPGVTTGLVSESPQEEGDLHTAFAKFRKARLEAKARGIKATGARPCRDKERIAELREQFAERVLGYVGVPYGKKFCSEACGTSDDGCENCKGSKLFLDCCALVRYMVAAPSPMRLIRAYLSR